MRAKQVGWVVAGAFVAIGATIGIAGAQQGEGAGPPADVGTQRDVNMTPQQMVGQAQGIVSKMSADKAQVQKMLTSARETNDVVKQLCLDEKLSEIGSVKTSAEKRVQEITREAGRAADDKGAEDKLRHAFTVMKVLEDRAAALVTEARQCIGEETGEIGESSVTVEVDPNMTPGDPSEFPRGEENNTPPILSSPVQ